MNKKLIASLTFIILVIFTIICIELNIVGKSENIITKQNVELQFEKNIEDIKDEDNNSDIVYDDIINDTNIQIEKEIIDNNDIDIIEDTNNADTLNYDGIHYQDMAREVLELVNQIRIDNNLNPLIWNDSLEMSAMVRATEIINTFEHTRPDGSSWYTTINTTYRTAGENIAAGQRTSQQVVDEWMASPGHRANILNPNYTEIGVALYYDSSDPYEYNWVQLFIGY